MHTAALLYAGVAAAFLASALPVLAGCVADVVNPRTTSWNRRAAALWIGGVVTLCALWPLTMVGAVVSLPAMRRETRKP